MPNLTEWLIVRGLEGVARAMAACGDEKAKRTVAAHDASRYQLKTFKKVHQYAQSKHISHEQAATEIGVTLPEVLFEQFRAYDPIRWKEGYPGMDLSSAAPRRNHGRG